MSLGGSIGIFTSFDHQSQDWSSYKARLNQWFIANDIEPGNDKLKVKRRAVLLSALSESTFKLARDLALPKKLEEVDFSEIVTLLDNHFTPKRVGFAEKSIFYSSMQRPGESHNQWAARLRGLAAHCGFKDLEEALLDRFIMGMLPGPERDKLFVQEQKDFNLAKAVDLAESVRCARLAAAAPAANPGDVALAAAAAGAGAAGADGVFAISKKEKCSVCGFSNHKANRCRYKNYQCKLCNRKGHLRKMCTYSNKVNCVEEVTMKEGDDGESLINSIRCKKGEPMTERVLVGGLLLEFQVDSGSAVSIIPNELYTNNFSHVPLAVTNKKLRSYTGEQIQTVGYVSLPVSYNNITQELSFFVVRNSGPSLLGRDFIRLFNLEFSPVNTIQSSHDSEAAFIRELTLKFPKLFSGDLGTFNKYTVELKLKPDSKPIFFKARAVPYSLKDKIDKELDRLVGLGILRPVDHSDYASPIVPALKKDGGIRICADFSVTINKQLIIDKYPLPTVQELFSRLHGGVHFSKLDLSMAYNQFRLSESSQELTCINTHRGLFKFTRLVFGLSSAPAIFQRAMECLLAGLEGTVFFLDDILVTGENQAVHKERLLAVLQRLEDAGLSLQHNKCEFFKNEISYLGHVIDKNGVRKSPEKVKAIWEAVRPHTVHQLQSFLGLINYYRNFIPDASSLLSPLYDLLRKNAKWEWSAAHENAFVTVKKILISDNVLTHFDPAATLILTVDASPTGLGAVLSQIGNDRSERPISFASRTLTTAEKKYSQIQKEATAIIFGVRRFHQYLYGRSVPFILRTDHRPLLSIFGPRRGIPEVSANRLQRYAMFLSAYNFTIEYVRSSDNNADFLSRAPLSEPGEAHARSPEPSEERAAYVNFVLEGSLPVTILEICRETDRDPVLVKVKEYVMNGWPRKLNDLELKPYHSCRTQFSVERGCLMRGHKVVVPTALRDTVCNELHSSHFGIVKMKAEARKHVWFPGIDAALERLAATCAVCAALRPAPPHAPLAPWPHPPHPFYRIHIDFLGPFLNQMYLIVVDAFSKWVECFPMASSYGSKAVINRLCELIARVGIPNVIVSDNGTSFTSEEFKNFCSLNGIKHICSPPYHPSSNGQAEAFVKIIKKGLKATIISNENKKPVQERILKFLFDYRNSKNSTTEKSPAELVYGRSLRSRLHLLNPVQTSPSSPELSKIVDVHQSSQIKHYRGKLRSAFKINDKVLITKNIDNNRFCWIEGVVKEKIGTVMYSIYVPELDREVRRHIDQMRAQASPSKSHVMRSLDPNVIPDLHSDGSSADQSATSSSTLDSTRAAEDLSSTELSLQPEGERECPTVEIEMSTTTESPEPIVNPRRQAVSPVFYSPVREPISSTDVSEPDPIQQNPKSRRHRRNVNYKQFF